MRSTRFWKWVVVSLLLAGPAGGFLFGILNPGDPDPNPIGRVAYACLMAALTPMHAGFPPNPETGVGHTLNVWPHIAVSFLLILGGFVLRNRRSPAKRIEPMT